MTERPGDTRLHDWLDETVGQIPDPVEGTRQVVSRIEGAPQAKRWLPFRHLRRYQATAIPASDGRTPTVIGRTHSMISPAKAVAAGAIVFALGSVLFVAQPFERQGTVPGAEAEPVAPTWVTGNIGWASCTGPDTEDDGGVIHEWNFDCSPQRWTASDPRLSGDVTARWNNDVYRVDDRYITVTMSLDILENDGGEWACSSGGLAQGRGLFTESLTGTNQTDTTCVGQGGYEGLSAMLVRTIEGTSEEFVGLIFSGDPPPLPEPPAAE